MSEYIFYCCLTEYECMGKLIGLFMRVRIIMTYIGPLLNVVSWQEWLRSQD
jgi:hypothetical protein